MEGLSSKPLVIHLGYIKGVWKNTSLVVDGMTEMTLFYIIYTKSV